MNEGKWVPCGFGGALPETLAPDQNKEAKPTSLANIRHLADYSGLSEAEMLAHIACSG